MSILAAAGPSAYWYLTRATGVVALLLLSASVVLGILGPLRVALGPRWPRFTVETLHRDLSLLVIVVLVVHILTTVLDSFAPVGLADSVIPFVSPYRPIWVGLGALSFDLIIALVITSLVRRRLGLRAWRAIHWLAYLSWPVAVLHGLGTGTDTKLWWMLALTAMCVAAVVAAVLARLRAAGRREPLANVRPGAGNTAASVRGPATIITLAVAVGIAVFTLAGPLQHGWARRAGTPARLLRGSRVRVTSTRVPTEPTTLKVPFEARLSGRVKQTNETGGAVIDLVLRMSGGANGLLRIRLAGAPLGQGGLSLTGSQVDLAATGLSRVLEGHVVSLQGERFQAQVRDISGVRLDLSAVLQIDQNSGGVVGTLRARA